MKELQRMLPSTLLIIAMVIGLRFTIFASDERANWYEKDKEAETFILIDEEDLRILSDLVNVEGEDFSGKTLILVDDVVLTKNFNPIGTKGNAFRGTFDGRNNTVSTRDGFVIGDITEYYQGLFGYAENATFKNINMNASVVGSGYTGSVIGYLFADDVAGVENCTNEGAVTGSESCVGGIIGYAEAQGEDAEITVENCSNKSEASVKSTDNDEVIVGGVAGYIATGRTGSILVSKSYNESNLENTGMNIGGLVGGMYQDKASRSTAKVEYCYNTGDVSGASMVGGLVGGNNSGTISDSYNTGDVSGSSMVGGIVAVNISMNETAAVEACYNIGAVEGSEKTGGIVGWNGNGVVENCYYNNETVGEMVKTGIGDDNNSQRVIPLTTMEMTGMGKNRADEKMIGFTTSAWRFTQDGKSAYYYPALSHSEQSVAPQVEVMGKSSSGSSISYIKVTTGNGGSISPNGGADHMQEVKKGNDIDFVIQADAGYMVADVLINGKSVGKVTSCEFTNVHSLQTLEVFFEEIKAAESSSNEDSQEGTTEIIVEDVKIPFTDVDITTENFDGIAYVYENNIMAGLSSEVFGKDMSITRGMIATILHRMDGGETLDGDLPFIDVAISKYYTEAVRWGKGTGVVSGVSHVEFVPNASITNEQFITFLYRYATYLGMDTTVSYDVDLSDYVIREYAYAAMHWAVEQGIIDRSNLNPREMALRGDVATALMNFMEL